MLELGNRSGFTIVEVIVATIILTVGLLGIVGAMGQMTRLRGRADRLSTASFYAQDRMEQLRALGCGAAASGTETLDGKYIMRWTVAARAGGTRAIMVEAEYGSGAATAAIDTFETWIPC